MSTIMDVRQKVLNRYKFDNEQVMMQILPIQKTASVHTVSDPEETITLATIKYEDYGNMILEIPDSPKMVELAKLKLKLKKVKQILNIIKINPMHGQNIQVNRAVACLKIINGETE